MDTPMNATRIDKNGMPQFNARTPSEDGKEFDAAKARAIGLPKWGRVEIRLNGRHVLRKAAKELHELADRLERLYGDLSRDETYLLREAHDEIRITANRLNPERCGPKPKHGDV